MFKNFLVLAFLVVNVFTEAFSRDEYEPLLSDRLGTSINKSSVMGSSSKVNSENIDVTAEHSTVIINSEVLIENSKFKKEYNQLKVRPSDSSIDEFENLIKVYGLNINMAHLYMNNFRDISENSRTREVNPIALEYYVDIRVDFWHQQLQLIDRSNACEDCAFCLSNCCDCNCDNDRTTIIKNYRECIEDYKRCKPFYKTGAPHLQQINGKIARAEEYVGRVNSTCAATNVIKLGCFISVPTTILILFFVGYCNSNYCF